VREDTAGKSHGQRWGKLFLADLVTSMRAAIVAAGAATAAGIDALRSQVDAAVPGAPAARRRVPGQIPAGAGIGGRP